MSDSIIVVSVNIIQIFILFFEEGKKFSRRRPKRIGTVQYRFEEGRIQQCTRVLYSTVGSKGESGWCHRQT